jgi:hypothetical protein
MGGREVKIGMRDLKHLKEAVAGIDMGELKAAFTKANGSLDALYAEFGRWQAIRRAGVPSREDHDRLSAAIEAVHEGRQPKGDDPGEG